MDGKSNCCTGNVKKFFKLLANREIQMTNNEQQTTEWWLIVVALNVENSQ